MFFLILFCEKFIGTIIYCSDKFFAPENQKKGGKSASHHNALNTFFFIIGSLPTEK
jgi:hypothetical protein